MNPVGLSAQTFTGTLAPKDGIRCRDRHAQWKKQIYDAANRLMANAPDQADAIIDYTEREVAKGPDFARYHRGSEFREAPLVNLDRNDAARIMFVADLIERKTWANREKGAHGGQLGRAAIKLLRVLLFVAKKSKGRLFPSYDHLARLCLMSRNTVIKAMQKLVLFGFVTRHRRIKRVQTPLGMRVVQDSNAYEYHLPQKGLGALAYAIFKPPSECKNSAARTVSSKTTSTEGAGSPQNGLGKEEAGLKRPPGAAKTRHGCTHE